MRRILAPIDRTQAATYIAAGVLAVGSCLILLGWATKTAILTSVVPGCVAMNPVTAILFLLSSVCLAAQVRFVGGRAAPYIVSGVSAIITTVGGLSLLSYFFVLPINVDRLLFTSQLAGNRMAPNTAFNFVLLGLAFNWPNQHWLLKRTKQVFLVVVLSSSLIAVLGYGYGAQRFYGIGAYIPMALNTAALFAIASAGLLLSERRDGPFAILFGDHLGSVLARQLLPAAVAIPCLLGFARVLGQRAGWYEMEFGAALMVALTVVMLVAAVAMTATALNRADVARVEAAEALKASSVALRDLYDNAPCGYHSLDSAGLIASMNDTELRWLGYARSEIEGRLHFNDLLSPESRERFRVGFEKLKMDGELANLHLELVRRSGSPLPVVVNASALFDETGEFKSSRFSVFDATEQRRAEQTIRQLNGSLEERVKERTRELANANWDLAQKNGENEMFVYSVSHDLRSPLVNLQGFSKELQLGIESLRDLLAAQNLAPEAQHRANRFLDEDMLRPIQFIQTAVTRLGGIIEALLRLSRAGRVEYRPESINVNDVVARVVLSMSGTVHDRGATVNAHELPKCWGDAVAVEQVFANLIGNALNYLDPQREGSVTIGATEPPPDGQSVTYFVQDNGVGIPEAYQAKVFQALKRMHPGMAKGEGMGLAIVRRIVERHGGDVRVESAEGKGSTFLFTLPAKPTTGRLSGTRTLERNLENVATTAAVGNSSGGR